MDEVRNHLEPERQIAQETENLHSREIDLCVECLEHLTKGFNEIGGSFAWEEPRATILLLATRGYNSLRWAWENAAKGILLAGKHTLSNSMGVLVSWALFNASSRQA